MTEKNNDYEQRVKNALEVFSRMAEVAQTFAATMRREVERGHETCCAEKLLILRDAVEAALDAVDREIGDELTESMNNGPLGQIHEMMEKVMRSASSASEAPKSGVCESCGGLIQEDDPDFILSTTEDAGPDWLLYHQRCQNAALARVEEEQGTWHLVERAVENSKN